MTFSIQLDHPAAEQLTDWLKKSQPEWLQPVLFQNLEAIDSMKPISRKNEHWKYNATDFLKDTCWHLLASETVSSGVPSFPELANATELQFAGGQLISPAIEVLNEVEGLKVCAFDELTQEQQEKLIQAYKAEEKSPNRLSIMAEFLASKPLFIQLDKSFAGPLVINHLPILTNGGDKAILAATLMYIDIEQNTEVTVIENYQTEQVPDAADTLHLKRSWFDIADNAKLQYLMLTQSSLNHRLVDTLDFLLSKDSRVNAFCFSPGGKLSRHDINLRHRAPGSEATLNGVYLPRHSQEIDFHTNIEHRAPHCTTHETFRGIIDDEASATFNGKIHIFPKAQKSDAFLSNKNLLLTNRAQVNTKPELEIYADDVRCAHGATVAQLDDKATYFLQTRGINKADAQKILSVAFVKSLINDIPFEPVRKQLASVVEQRLT